MQYRLPPFRLSLGLWVHKITKRQLLYMRRFVVAVRCAVGRRLLRDLNEIRLSTACRTDCWQRYLLRRLKTFYWKRADHRKIHVWKWNTELQKITVKEQKIKQKSTKRKI